VKRLACVIAVLTALGVGADSALASGFGLQLTSPRLVVGQPAILHANGTIPVEDIGFPYWFSLDAIPTSVTKTCPEDAFEGSQLASSTGGSIVVLTQSERPNGSGEFSIPVGVTPSAPGSLLLCGYTDDGAASTLAVAPLIVHIHKAGAARHRSSASRIAGEAASGVRSCRALLDRPAPCIRDVVKHANVECRRLKAPRSRKQCLRGVRRAAR
jgi:hypothetical protein